MHRGIGILSKGLCTDFVDNSKRACEVGRRALIFGIVGGIGEVREAGGGRMLSAGARQKMSHGRLSR